MTKDGHPEESSSPELTKCCLPLSSGLSDAPLRVYTGRQRGKQSCGSLREEEGAGLWQEKETSGPALRLTHPYTHFISGLHLSFVHLRTVGGGNGEWLRGGGGQLNLPSEV